MKQAFNDDLYSNTKVIQSTKWKPGNSHTWRYKNFGEHAWTTQQRAGGRLKQYIHLRRLGETGGTQSRKRSGRHVCKGRWRVVK